MTKPKALSTRQTSAAISRLNNALPRFPKGNDDDKFTEAQLTTMLEWSLPAKWREQFDLKGYTPTQHTRARLILECEALERYQTDERVVDVSNNNKRKRREKTNFGKSQFPKEKSEKAKATFFCTEHGYNNTHGTANCYTLANRNKSTKSSDTRKTFSKNALRKEIHMLSKSSSKKEVLENYITTLIREREKLEHNEKKRKNASNQDDSSESEDDMSVNQIEPLPKRKVKDKSQRPSRPIAGIRKKGYLGPTKMSNESNLSATSGGELKLKSKKSATSGYVIPKKQSNKSGTSGDEKSKNESCKSTTFRGKKIPQIKKGKIINLTGEKSTTNKRVRNDVVPEEYAFRASVRGSEELESWLNPNKKNPGTSPVKQVDHDWFNESDTESESSEDS